VHLVSINESKYLRNSNERLEQQKTQKAWAFYDWANSVYPLVITTAIFPIFYNAVTTTKVNGIIVSDRVMWFGREFANTEIYSYIIAASLIVVSILSPMLSGIADYSGKKKFFMKIFCYLGSISCATLFFFNSERLELSFMALFFASIGYWNSIVFYNAFCLKWLHQKTKIGSVHVATHWGT